MKLFKQAIILMVLTFTITQCSTDDNGDPPQEQEMEQEQEEMEEESADFEAVTIDLRMADFDSVNDETFTVQGFTFRHFQAVPLGSEGEFAGVGVFGGSTNGESYIELDLSEVTGIMRISPRIAQSTETPITFFNGDEVVAEIMAVSSTVEESFMDNPYDLNGQEVTAVRITSLEAIVQSITLE